MSDPVTILFALALIVGFYMAWNIGANDVANAMGTSVGSGALNLRRAVIVAATLEFGGAFLAGSDVSQTVMKGIIKNDLFLGEPMLLAYGMLASLLAAGVWLQLASYFGWPVSTTHSIIGAILGFGVMYGGVDAVQWTQVGWIVMSWVSSPLLGGTLSFIIFTYLRRNIFYTAHPVAAVKRLAPFVVFVVVTILSSFLIFKGLKNLHIVIDSNQAIFLSSVVGLIGAALSFFFMRRIENPATHEEMEERHDPHMLISLKKASKHLGRAKEASRGHVKFQVSQMKQELDDLSTNVRQGVAVQVKESEYETVERVFVFLQILTACMMAFAHGANDVANAIGPIAAIVHVVKTGTVPLQAVVPVWILALGGLGIVIGLATWGWRVIDTVGKKITELTPSRGFAAEFGAATTILLASKLGLPISTTHTLIGAILGVGLARGIEAINMNVVRDIFTSWVITIPAGAGLSVCFFQILQLIF